MAEQDPRELLTRKTSALTVGLYPGDWKLVDWLAEYLGCSRAEAARSAIRSMASQLAQLEKRSTHPRD